MYNLGDMASASDSNNQLVSDLERVHHAYANSGGGNPWDWMQELVEHGEYMDEHEGNGFGNMVGDVDGEGCEMI